MIQPFFEDKSKPYFIAHRGSNVAGPMSDNIAEAFEAIVALGVKYLETDAVLTKDGEVVLYHGSRNKKEQRQTGYPTRSYIQSRTYEELCGSDDLTERNIPRLEDALLAFPNSKFSIDAKTNEVVAPLVAIIKRLGVADRVCVASFSIKRLRRLQKGFESNIATAYCVHPALSWLLRYCPGIFFKCLNRCDIDCAHIPHGVLNRRVVNCANQNDVRVFAWTVNDVDMLRKCLDLNIDGVISDEPNILTSKKVVNSTT